MYESLAKDLLWASLNDEEKAKWLAVAEKAMQLLTQQSNQNFGTTPINPGSNEPVNDPEAQG